MADTNERIVGTDGDDTIDAEGGYDIVMGGAGDDDLTGGEGNDFLRGGSGEDTLSGGEGGDTLRGGSGDDELYGGNDDDLLMGDGGDDELYGGAGDDTLDSGTGDDTLTGGEGSDTFVFAENEGSNTITDFNVAEDTIDLRLIQQAVAYSDLTITDKTDGTGVTITHTALGGTITLNGVSASDLSASNFNMPDGSTTSIHTNNGTVLVWENPYEGDFWNNRMSDGENDTRILGHRGDDTILAGEGDDVLEGGADDDELFGEEGDDTIDGGADNDTLWGGSGNDTFVFQADHGNDTIKDFTDGEDVIDLKAITDITGFGDLTITADGTTAVINLTEQGGGTIRLENVNVDVLDATDFQFHEPPVDDGGTEGM